MVHLFTAASFTLANAVAKHLLVKLADKLMVSNSRVSQENLHSHFQGSPSLKLREDALRRGEDYEETQRSRQSIHVNVWTLKSLHG